MPHPAGVRTRAAAIAVAAFAAAGCQSASSPDSRGALTDDRPGTPIVHQVNTAFAEPARFTIRSPEAWADAWSRAFAGTSEPPPRPSIDFSRDMVVVAAQGTQGSSGYDISIDRVASEEGSIAVDVTTTSPGPDCMVLTVITSPVMMVRVPASASPVRFIEHDRTRRCE